MQWNDKLARKILEAVESFKPGESRNSRIDLIVEGYDRNLVAYHVDGLCKKGLLKAANVTTMSDVVPMHLLMGLTPHGHGELARHRERVWLGHLKVWGWKLLLGLAAALGGLAGVVYRDPILDWLRAVLPFAKR